MRKIVQVIVLVILVAVAGFLWWQRREAGQRKPRPQVQQAQAQPAGPAPLTKAPVLPDGSFNPVPSERIPLGQQLKAADLQSWRKVLPAKSLARSGKRFFVYPFLDRTRSGLGDCFTYAWHPLGMGALGVWSDAQLQPVANYELLPGGDAWSSQTASADLLTSLSASIAANPDLTGAERVIAGIYEDGQATNTVRLSVYLLFPKETKPPVKVVETPEMADRDFDALATSQRNAAREMVAKLADLGEVKTAKAAISEKELGECLARTANLLDISDSMAIEEGIDSAMALARLAPEEPAPLQAAAQGYMHVLFYVENNGPANLCSRDYMMRAYALTQMSLTHQRGQDLSLLNWYAVNNLLGHSFGDTKAETLKDVAAPLQGTWVVASHYKGTPNPSAVEAFPDWQRLWLEQNQSENVRSSVNRHFFTECAANEDRDLLKLLRHKKAIYGAYTQENQNLDFD